MLDVCTRCMGRHAVNNYMVKPDTCYVDPVSLAVSPGLV
jgi:hypothetical protein